MRVGRILFAGIMPLVVTILALGLALPAPAQLGVSDLNSGLTAADLADVLGDDEVHGDELGRHGGQNQVKALDPGRGKPEQHAPDPGHDSRRAEVVIMSRNSTETSLRIFNSIEHYGLDIERAALSGGAPLAGVRLEIEGVLLTMFDSRLNLSKQVKGEAAKLLRASVPIIYNETAADVLYEGRSGASPREVKTAIFNAAQNPNYPCLSPLAVLEELRRLKPDFETRVSELLARNPAPDWLREEVLDGLRSAGLR